MTLEDALGAIPFQSIGLGSIVTLVILLIIRGDIVTRKQHDEVRADRDDWKRIALELMDVNTKTVKAAETTTAVLEALPRPSREDPAP